MTLPPSDFADAFAAHVVPRLRAGMPARGLFVALGLEGFTEAAGAVMAEAMRLGAKSLPPEHLTALDNWIGVALLDAIREKQPIVDAANVLADRVGRDVDAWNRRVLSRFEGEVDVADGR